MKKRIILSCHCVLNKYSKLQSAAPKNPDIAKLVSFLIKEEIGIIQLPCPEMHMYGPKRWGHVKEQFQTSHYRKISRKLLQATIGQVKDYIDNGYELLGTISIEGSPSCGAFKTCKSEEWGGEFKDMDIVSEKVSRLEYTEGRGVFLEELDKMMEEIDIEPKYFGFYGDDVEGLISDIKSDGSFS